MLQVLAGHDSGDPASIDTPVPDFTARLDHLPPTLRIRCREHSSSTTCIRVEAAIERQSGLRDLHAEIHDVKLEVSTDRTLSSAESFAYHETFVAQSAELYQPATLVRIQSAANTSAAAVLRARRELEISRHAIRKIFENVDILLTSTVPVPPPAISELKSHPENLRPAELLICTRPLCVGSSTSRCRADLQQTVRRRAATCDCTLARDLVLQVAQCHERATDWRNGCQKSFLKVYRPALDSQSWLCRQGSLQQIRQAQPQI
jgi:aspartyl-tRNA(Asn)/glutamyl-tRNA(Gln) amidotransferase subunit A